MSIGIFQLVKNEYQFIGPWLMRNLPVVDRIVIYDGNSYDGTLDIINHVIEKYDVQKKIKLVLDKDPKDLKDDYVKLFNECMWELDTDLAWFLHPDMFITTPERVDFFRDSDCIAGITNMRSFAGDPGTLYEVKGRGGAWKNIYRLRNPDLGAHYHGWYGAANEDIYFSSITGDEHEHHGIQFKKYPYHVMDVGLEALHFSDVRPYERRLNRMMTCLENQGLSKDQLLVEAAKHPRVTLRNGNGFEFIPSTYPEEFIKWSDYFRSFRKELVNA